MEGIAWLILTVIISIVLFVILCKSTTTIAFGGVEGLVGAYLSNLLWVGIISAGISAFIIYAIEGIAGFLFNLIFNEFTALLVAFIAVLYFCLDRGVAIKTRFKDLRRDKKNFIELPIRYTAGEDGIHSGVYYFIDKNRVNKYDGNLYFPAVRITVKDYSKPTTTTEEFEYILYSFLKVKGSENLVNVEIEKAKDPKSISVSGTSVSTLRSKKKSSEDILHEIAEGEENCGTFSYDEPIDITKNSENARLYKFIVDEHPELIFDMDEEEKKYTKEE